MVIGLEIEYSEAESAEESAVSSLGSGVDCVDRQRESRTVCPLREAAEPQEQEGRDRVPVSRNKPKETKKRRKPKQKIKIKIINQTKQ